MIDESDLESKDFSTALSDVTARLQTLVTLTIYNGDESLRESKKL
jgi:hypothetical protein